MQLPSAWTRSIWLDVAENAVGWVVVARGEDKVKSGANPSTASDPADVKEHAPRCVWTGADGDPIPYVIDAVAFGTESDAAAVRDELLAFFRATAALESPEAPDATAGARAIMPALIALYTSGHIGAYHGEMRAMFDAADAWAALVDGLSDGAKTILPILLAAFGTGQTAELRKPGRIGTYADWRSKRAERESEKLREFAERAEKARRKAEKHRAALEKHAMALGIDPSILTRQLQRTTSEHVDPALVAQIVAAAAAGE